MGEGELSYEGYKDLLHANLVQGLLGYTQGVKYQTGDEGNYHPSLLLYRLMLSAYDNVHRGHICGILAFEGTFII